MAYSVYTGRHVGLEQLVPLYSQGTASALWIPTGSRVLDYSGGGHHGTLNGSAFIERDPVVGHVVSSKASGDYVDFGAVGADTDPVTVMLLVRPNRVLGGSVSEPVIIRGEDNAGAGQSFIIADQWTTGSLEPFPFVQIINSVVGQFFTTVNPNVTVFSWHHFAATQDWANNVLKFYVDGVFVASAVTTGTAFRSSTVGWRLFTYFTSGGVANTALASVAYASVRNVVLAPQQILQEFEIARRVFNLV
jgi:hypothetical protein